MAKGKYARSPFEVVAKEEVEEIEVRPYTPWLEEGTRPSGQAKTLPQYFTDRLIIAGFDILEQDHELIAWDKAHPEDSFILKFTEPGAYSPMDATGIWKQKDRQRELLGLCISWVYEYYTGGAFR